MKRNAPLDSYGGWTGLRGEKTGFFRVEKIDGRWRMVSPEGNLFYPVSICHFLAGDTRKAVENIYGGSQEDWIRDSVDKIRGLGFNCAAAGVTSPERDLGGFLDQNLAEEVFRRKRLPFMVGIISTKHPWEFSENEILPDIFSDTFEQRVSADVEEVCTRYREDPLVMGYYYGFGTFITEARWINQLLAGEANSPGKTALVGALRQRYGQDTAAYNRTYGAHLTSFDDLAAGQVHQFSADLEKRNFAGTRPGLDTQQAGDFEAVLRCLSLRYYSLMHKLIRRYDENHLLFGSFVKEWSFAPQTWKALAPYIDVLSPQHCNPEVDIDEFAEATGLPILVSDEEYGFYYGDLSGEHKPVRSMAKRARLYDLCARRHFHDPSVLGVTFCATLYDQHGDNHNGGYTGFYMADGSPRKPFMKTVVSANGRVYIQASDSVSQRKMRRFEHRYFRGQQAWKP